MPQLQLWNAWQKGGRLAFDVVIPGYGVPVRRGHGPWLEAAATALGATPSGVATLRPARFAYPGDYFDSADWQDRWPQVTLVEVEVMPGIVTSLQRDSPFVHLWADDDTMIDVDGEDDPAHDETALLVVDFPSGGTPSTDWLAAMSKLGPTEERVFDGPPIYTKLQPIRQVRTVARVAFPAAVPALERLLEDARSLGGSCDWHLTFHPDHV